MTIGITTTAAHHAQPITTTSRKLVKLNNLKLWRYVSYDHLSGAIKIWHEGAQ